MGRGERQRGIVATKRGQACAHVLDGGAEPREARVGGCPREEGRGAARDVGDSGAGHVGEGRQQRGAWAGVVDTIGSPCRDVHGRVDAGALDGQVDSGRPERDRTVQGDHDRGEQLAVRPCEDRPCRSVVRPGAEDPVERAFRLIVGGDEREPPGCLGSRADHLRESFAVVLHEAHGPVQDDGRTSVVHLQVDPAEARERGLRETQQATDVGKPPTVDGLVVVADQEDAVRGRGQEQCHAQLGSVQVLRLVDEQLTASGAPSLEDVGVPFQQPQRPGNQVVEVEPTPGGDLRFIPDEGAGRGSGVGVGGDGCRLDAEVQLQPREHRVEPCEFA